MWLQNECIRWAKGPLRRRGGYRKGIDGDILQNRQKCLQCRRDVFVAGKSLPSDLKNGYSLFL